MSSIRLAVSTGLRRANASTSSVRLFGGSSQNNKGSILDSAGDYFSSLRWKAANALTESLPADQRNQLLERMEPKMMKAPDNNNKEQQPMVSERSIDELIAAAKAEAAAKYEAQYNKRLADKEEAMRKEAEEAARKRVESDIILEKRRLAFEAWQQNLKREMDSVSQTYAGAVKQEAMAKLGDHPILGPVIADLGSKRLHVVTAEALAAVPVWKKQRTYRHARAKEMASDKMKTLHLGLPGVIGIYESSDGNLSIIDGQHRMGMLRELSTRSGVDGFDFDRILVEVYPQKEGMDEMEHAQEFFSEVNKAQPVRLLDLPGMAKPSHLNMINGAAKSIKDLYPEMFSESNRCRPPHLNEDNLRDAIFAAGVIERHSLKTPKQLQDWIMTQNEIMQAKLQDEEAQQKVNAKAFEKAVKFGFYLGLGNDWYYN